MSSSRSDSVELELEELEEASKSLAKPEEKDPEEPRLLPLQKV